ncbi:hypothetical protein M3172_04125 [Mesobacillus subterraneus]|uniref:hypothetical protein n=1 Tax=Mesobacillus subterraneus TaxID=285983 RepID=UPI0020411BDA|nr:hypothetical protein [Mesobacillus subterraneus]MCM3572363.1 hypothetical protein [Mesobacillus subterraneus]
MREKPTGKLLADYHLETFLQCPYKFYHRFVTGKKLSKVALLRLIQQYWGHIPLHLFQDKAQYYTILAKMTDHLLQALTKKEIDSSPLFLYEQFQTTIEEINVSLKFEIGNWSDRSFTVSKFLWMLMIRW